MTSLALRMTACTGALASTAVGACDRVPPAERAWLRLSLPAAPLQPATLPSGLRVRPAGAVVGAERAASVVVLEIDRDKAREGIVIEADGACPVRVAPGEIPPGAVHEARLLPMVDYGAPRADLGFDTAFTLDAKAGCDDTSSGAVEWRQIAGAPLRDLTIINRGFHLAARMPPATEILDAERPWGLVPISPRTRGEIVLEAIYSSGGRRTRTEVRLAAAARSRGLPNVPVGVRQLLGGDGWRVVDHPMGGKAMVEGDGLLGLRPDVSGLWRLRDGKGRDLVLRAGRYDETPLDCGRSGCHGDIVAGARSSPMTAALAHRMDPRTRTTDDAACALPCHSVGEPGLSDGGFTATAAALGQPVCGHGAFADLPPQLRRLGGVGCLACHGPGAVPEPAARWSQLRADVCAYCHDAPPRYGHVVAWRTSRMATSDRDPRTRSRPACARCHTTGGFLASLAPAGGSGAVHPPATPAEGTGAIGIACAACHTVHPAPGPVAPALLRRPGSALCVVCHSPDLAAGVAYASAAAVVLGTGGVEPGTGAPLTGPAAHGTNGGGCTACHRGGPDGLGRGASHAFRSTPASCTTCHPTGPRIDADLPARATRLWNRWRARGDLSSPPHAATGPLDRTTALGAALWNVLLVVEDPAAAIHNAPYARRLLDTAEATLGQLAPRDPGEQP